MKSINRYYCLTLVWVVLLFCSTPALWGQCVPRVGTYYGEMLPNLCQTWVASAVYSPGTYFRMPLLLGGSYGISTCGNGIDTQITGFQGATTNPSIYYNDDTGPHCAGLQASINYVSTFNDYTRVAVQQWSCQPGGTSSITVFVRQNNNLTITSTNTDMCSGQSRTLFALPSITTPFTGNAGNGGTFTGLGVSGSVFIAPTPGGNSQTYTITYTFGYCNATQNITVYRTPSTASVMVVRQTVWSGPALAVVGSSSRAMVTWSVEGGQAPLEILHSKTFAPGPSVFTTVVGELGETNNPDPEITFQVPVPIAGMLPAIVVLVAHNV